MVRGSQGTTSGRENYQKEMEPVKAWYREQKWHVNPMNFFPEVTADFDLPDKVLILDSTIRKMTGTSGCNWSIQGAVDICTMADEVGVDYVEVNIVHGSQPPSKKMLDMFEAIAKKDFRFKLFGTARPTKESMDDVIDRGSDGINVSSRDMKRLTDVFGYIKSKGLLYASHPGGGRLEHVPPEETVKRINELAKMGIEYAAIHENTGATTPEAWRYAMKRMRSMLEPEVKNVPIIPHIHNMLGGGTMTAVAAVTGGARGIDVSCNGIAIHCGLAALEEVVTILEVLYGVETNIKLEKLQEYSKVVEKATGLPVHYNKPLVGSNAFMCELESFVHDVLVARERGEERIHPIAPSLVGSENVLVWGENTLMGFGTEVKLKQLGLSHDRATVGKVVEAMEAELATKTAYPVYLTEPEVDALCKRVAGSPS